jgi:hypothetical protein
MAQQKTKTHPQSGARKPHKDSDVPRRDDLTRDERPGGELEMPQSDRARPQRRDSNSKRDSNDRGSGVST